MTAFDNAASFHAEATAQLICAVCGRGGAFHAHHVVSKAELKHRRAPLNDPRNALRLCVRCHMQHEWAGPGKVDVALSQLTDDNFCFAFEVMGAAAMVYLERFYVGADLRLAAHVEGRCDLCRR